MRIGIDLDGCLATGFAESYARFAVRRYPNRADKIAPTGIIPTIADEWNFFLKWGISITEFKYDLSHFASDIFGSIEPHPQGRDVLARLINDGHTVIINTARPLSAAEVTARWVNEHLRGLKLGGLYISLDNIKSHVDMDVIFDDSPENLENLTEAEIAVVRFKHDYNEYLGFKYPVARDFEEFYEIIRWIEAFHDSKEAA